jgi:hypothetical protein
MASAELTRLKRSFFDRGKVAAMLDKKARKMLSGFGAFTRTRAQTSMKTPPKKAVKAEVKRTGREGAKPASPPGTPPFAHGRKLLRKMLFFAYEEQRKTVVVGPVRLAETASQHVPKVQEFGGSTTRRMRTRKGKAGGTETVKYPPRPFMKPAFEMELMKLRAKLRNRNATL